MTGWEVLFWMFVVPVCLVVGYGVLWLAVLLVTERPPPEIVPPEIVPPETCRYCKYFQVQGPTSGRCLRRAPVAMTVETSCGPDVVDMFPPVQHNDWCGEFALVVKWGWMYDEAGMVVPMGYSYRDDWTYSLRRDRISS